MARPRLHDPDELRTALVEAASRLLSTEGPAALTTRRLAHETSSSPPAIYALFGDKDGLLAAVYREGFARLGAALAAVPHHDDPVAELVALGLAYRTNARTNPFLYQLMFGRPLAGFPPDDAQASTTLGGFTTVIDAAARAVRDGRFRPADPIDVALALHGLVHGLASLELLGWLGDDADADARWHLALTAAAAGYASSVAPLAVTQASSR